MAWFCWIHDISGTPEQQHLSTTACPQPDSCPSWVLKPNTLRTPCPGLTWTTLGNPCPGNAAFDVSDTPLLQGGPHNHQITALAVALKYARTPEFKAYQQQVKANAQALGARLVKLGHKIVTDGTDNHLVLWDLRPEVILSVNRVSALTVLQRSFAKCVSALIILRGCVAALTSPKHCCRCAHTHTHIQYRLITEQTYFQMMTALSAGAQCLKLLSRSVTAAIVDLWPPQLA